MGSVGGGGFGVFGLSFRVFFFSVCEIEVGVYRGCSVLKFCEFVVLFWFLFY